MTVQLGGVGEILEMLSEARRDQPRRADLGGFSGPWLVYGAGRMGREVARGLLSTGRTVDGFLDKAKTGELDGLPVYAPAGEAAQSMCLSGHNVAIAVNSPVADASAVRSDLLGIGYKSVWMPQELVEALSDVGFFWLAPLTALEQLDEQAIHDTLCCFRDPRSLDAIMAVVRWRLLGASDRMPVPNVKRQYLPEDLPAIPCPLQMIDCGAYTGDTLLAFVDHGAEIKSYVALEPDPANYAALVKQAAKVSEKVFCIPCAAWLRAEMLAFSIDDSASAITKSPDCSKNTTWIQALSIDEALYSVNPNFIKMDIEGAEPMALNGAARTIDAFQPRLAIAGYHAPMDLWNIPVQIKGLMMQNGQEQPEMALRIHALSSFETIVYAWR